MKMRPGVHGSKRMWLIVAGAAFVIVAGLFCYTYMIVPRLRTEAPKINTHSPVSGEDDELPSLRFAAMGDMLAHDSVVSQARTTSGYDFSGYFAEIRTLYQGSDVVFCNAESPAAGHEYGISGYPTFNAPTEFVRDLSGAGCNMINLANNHMVDKGQAAVNATLDEWDKYEMLAVAGANRSADEQNAVRYFEKNDIVVAFLAFADFSNAALPHSFSVNLYHDTALVETLMKEARQRADAVIVSMHWGTEDSHEVNSDQRQSAQMLADLGADVIIGTGPHVLQPVEWLTRTDGAQTLTWYSIGNMLSSQLQVDELTGGVAGFTVTNSGKGIAITDISFTGTFMSYEWSEADAKASRLEARRNLKLQPLDNAQAEARLFGTTVEERSLKLREWLGSEADIAILN